MIQRRIDPALKNLLDIVEINHHTPVIQRLGAEVDLYLGVVAMEKAAFPFVVKEPVAVAEMNFFRHSKHRGMIIG